MKFILPLLLILFTSITPSNAQEKLPLTSFHWDTSGVAQVSFDTILGRPVITLQGNITALTPTFSNGRIEVDVLANEKRSFAGITFRKKDGTSEEVYIRTHKSAQPDAVQYTPIFNVESTWQLYHTYQANANFHKTGWNTIRVDVHGERADVYLNDQKVISVDQLKTDNQSGSLGLFSLFENHFSNFRYTEGDINLSPVKSLNGPMAKGTITTWDISNPNIYNKEAFNTSEALGASSIPAQTESTGLLPISKFLIKSSAGNFERNPEIYTVASHKIEVAEDIVQKFSFDYSDKIIVYLNGVKLFYGNNAFRAKGVQFKGNLNVDTNQLFLPLSKGENLLQCVVIDRANGWGLIGKLE